VTVEPRVEDLLASIRKAIDDDLGGLGEPASSSTSSRSQGTLMRGAMREMRVNYADQEVHGEQADTEIAQLRERIGRSRIESSFSTAPAPVPRLAPAPSPSRRGISSILSGETKVPPPNPPFLRQTIVADDPFEGHSRQEAEAPYGQHEWPDQQHGYEAPAQDDYYVPPPQTALVSPQTAYSAQSSFQHLADSILARATGDRSLEDVTRELLRGMLKTWLDDNLPELVERLVREEIERVARRGR
jgi:uncharacterized protein